jgi:hypothetical protein
MHILLYHVPFIRMSRLVVAEGGIGRVRSKILGSWRRPTRATVRVISFTVVDSPAAPLIKSVTKSSLADIHLASTCPRWPTTQRWSLPPPSNPYPSSAIPHLTTTSIHRPLHPRKSLPPSTPPPTPSPLRTQSRQMSFVNARAASLSHRFLTSVSNSPTSPASSPRRPGGRWRTSPCEIRSYFLLRRAFYGTWQCTDGGSGIVVQNSAGRV